MLHIAFRKNKFVKMLAMYRILFCFKVTFKIHPLCLMVWSIKFSHLLLYLKCNWFLAITDFCTVISDFALGLLALHEITNFCTLLRIVVEIKLDSDISETFHCILDYWTKHSCLFSAKLNNFISTS